MAWFLLLGLASAAAWRVSMGLGLVEPKAASNCALDCFSMFNVVSNVSICLVCLRIAKLC